MAKKPHKGKAKGLAWSVANARASLMEHERKRQGRMNDEIKVLRRALDTEVLANRALRAALAPFAEYDRAALVGRLTDGDVIVTKGTISARANLTAGHIRQAAITYGLSNVVLADIERRVAPETKENPHAESKDKQGQAPVLS